MLMLGLHSESCDKQFDASVRVPSLLIETRCLSTPCKYEFLPPLAVSHQLHHAARGNNTSHSACHTCIAQRIASRLALPIILRTCYSFARAKESIDAVNCDIARVFNSLFQFAVAAICEYLEHARIAFFQRG